MIDSYQLVARFEPISWQLPDKIEQVDILLTSEGSNRIANDINADVNADING